jgi:hypothetical protein
MSDYAPGSSAPRGANGIWAAQTFAVRGRAEICQKFTEGFPGRANAKSPMSTPAASGPRRPPTTPPQRPEFFRLPQAFSNQCVRPSGALRRQGRGLSNAVPWAVSPSPRGWTFGHVEVRSRRSAHPVPPARASSAFDRPELCDMASGEAETCLGNHLTIRFAPAVGHRAPPKLDQADGRKRDQTSRCRRLRDHTCSPGGNAP